MHFLQLNPPIPCDTPKGPAFCIAMIDYSQEHDTLWKCIITATGEVWDVPQPEVRGVKNVSMGRRRMQHVSIQQRLAEACSPSAQGSQAAREWEERDGAPATGDFWECVGRDRTIVLPKGAVPASSGTWRNTRTLETRENH